jgi:hypothetical protein
VSAMQQYKSDELMNMASAFAESAEDLLANLDGNLGHPLTWVIARALLANAYASLAFAAATRERTDTLYEMLTSSPKT